MSISFSAEGARSHTPALVRGMRDGVPIALGYFAVSFSLGIAARNAGLNAFQGFLVSLLNNASAGEYAGFTTIAADASYLEIAVVTLIANARYLLMSCSLSQKFAPGTPMRHRLLVGYDVTDVLRFLTTDGSIRITCTARFSSPRRAGPSAQRWAWSSATCFRRAWSAR